MIDYSSLFQDAFGCLDLQLFIDLDELVVGHWILFLVDFVSQVLDVLAEVASLGLDQPQGRALLVEPLLCLQVGCDLLAACPRTRSRRTR